MFLFLFILINIINLSFCFDENDLNTWYGNNLLQYADAIISLNGDNNINNNNNNDIINSYSNIRSIKVAAFFDSMKELNRRITELLYNEVSEEYSKQWQNEAIGFISGSIHKIIAHQNVADNIHINTICETGFNVGYSSLNFLLSNPNAQIISFDIMQYKYSSYAV
jgi:hypothetical protein